MNKSKPLFFFLSLLMLISLIPFVSSTSYPLQNILVPNTNPTETQDGVYGSIGVNRITGIGYTLPSDTNGTGTWYINTVMIRGSFGGANNLAKAVIVDENKTIIAISNLVVSENTSLLWYPFTFNVNPIMYPNEMYWFGIIIPTGNAFYIHVKLNSYAAYSDFVDLTNDFTNPTNPTDGTFYGTGQYSIYVTVSNFASKAYNYVYEPNSINSGTGAIWAYDYPLESYGVDAYAPIGVPITYTGNCFDGGLKSGNGTFTVNKTPLSLEANQWQVGIYTNVLNGTVTNGVFTFGFTARSSIGYEGVQIIINITSPCMMNPIYTIHHNFKWGADSSGNIPIISPTPYSGSGSATTDSIITILLSIFGNITTDFIFIIFGVVCGLLTWKFALTGLVAGIGISTFLCVIAGLLPIWAVGLCIVIDITIIVLGSGLLNKSSNTNVGN